MKFFLLIGAFFSSLFGIHSHDASSTPSTSSTETNTVIQTQVNDQQMIQNIITGMFNAYRGVKTFVDLEHIAGQYATATATEQLNAAFGKYANLSAQDFQKLMVSISNLYPDPSSLHFNITVNGDTATAIAPLPSTTASTKQIVNGKPVTTTVMTTTNTVTILFHKEGGVWKVSKVSFTTQS